MVSQSIKPIRTVLRWQLIATGALTLAAAFIWGFHGAASAALGGVINLVAGFAYGWRVTRVEARTAGEAVATLFRAWGIKVLLIIVGLFLVLKFYKGIVPAAFLVAFVVTVGLFAAAIAVDDANKQATRPTGEQ
jgi:ATP synthase protein I